MRTLNALAHLVLAVLLAAGCAPKEAVKAEPEPAPEPPARRAEAPAPPTMPPPPPLAVRENAAPSAMSLDKFLRLTTSRQYFPPEGIYAPPPESMADQLLVQLAMEPAELHLGTDVTSHAASDNGLAMGFENGEIRIYGHWPCSGLALAEEEPVTHLAWSGDSPYLAAAGPESETIALFDLRHCAQVKAVDAHGMVKDLRMSPKGTYLASVNMGNELYSGPALGPLSKVATLRFANLGLVFTAKEGLLIAVDQAGWVLLFAPSKNEVVSRMQIPGGPFASCDLDPPLATLEPEEGEPVVWDIAEQAPAEFRRKKSGGFDLRNGVLFYTTRKPLPVKKVHLGAPAFQVDVCPDRGLVRVKDLDGADRYFDLDSGGQAAPQECGSWQRVRADRQGGFCFGDVCGTLADRIFQSGHMRLMARRVPSAGYFLWWVRTPRPDEYNPLPGSLPDRTGTSLDERLKWSPITPEARGF